MVGRFISRARTVACALRFGSPPSPRRRVKRAGVDGSTPLHDGSHVVMVNVPRACTARRPCGDSMQFTCVPWKLERGSIEFMRPSTVCTYHLALPCNSASRTVRRAAIAPRHAPRSRIHVHADTSFVNGLPRRPFRSPRSRRGLGGVTVDSFSNIATLGVLLRRSAVSRNGSLRRRCRCSRPPRKLGGNCVDGCSSIATVGILLRRSASSGNGFLRRRCRSGCRRRRRCPSSSHRCGGGGLPLRLRSIMASILVITQNVLASLQAQLVSIRGASTQPAAA